MCKKGERSRLQRRIGINTNDQPQSVCTEVAGEIIGCLAIIGESLTVDPVQSLFRKTSSI